MKDLHKHMSCVSKEEEIEKLIVNHITSNPFSGRGKEYVFPGIQMLIIFYKMISRLISNIVININFEKSF